MTFRRSNAGTPSAVAGWLALTPLALLVGWLPACAGGDVRESDRARLRVGTSGDYAPFSTASGPGWGDEKESSSNSPSGFDPTVASAYAAERGLAIEWVPFRWPDLLSDLAADRFDIAMSGVTVRPDRSLAGRFSVAVCQSGAVLLIDPESAPLRGHSRGDGIAHTHLDRAEVRIAVNAGGHLERVTRRRFPNARVVAVPDNSAVLEMVLSGRADAAASDTQEAPSWLARAPSFELWGPFTSDRKAYLMGPASEELAADLDDWLREREADGQLDAWRRAHLKGKQPRLAAGLPSLLSGIAERLALMPWVAEAKRSSGGAIEVPEREERVIEAGMQKTREVARARGVPAPDPEAVRSFYRAQIEAAKAIQRSVLAGPATSADPPDLSTELRPALIRIGDRLAGTLVGLSSDVVAPRPAPDEIRAMTRAALSPLELPPDAIDAIALSINQLSSRRSELGGAGAP
jgi:cyclohexadienyl dehydratase